VRRARDIVCIIAATIGTVLGLTVVDAHATQRAARCLDRPDTAVFGIKLADGASVRTILGTKYEYFGHEGTSLEPAHFMSRDGKQIFTMTHHPGDTVDFHREFDVRYAGHSVVEQSLPTSAFATDNGVRLGLTKAAVTRRFGSCFKVVKQSSGQETIRYEDKGKKSALVKRYKMPLYYAEYEFTGSRLSRFQFGFEHP